MEKMKLDIKEEFSLYIVTDFII